MMEGPNGLPAARLRPSTSLCTAIPSGLGCLSRLQGVTWYRPENKCGRRAPSQAGEAGCQRAGQAADQSSHSEGVEWLATEMGMLAQSTPTSYYQSLSRYCFPGSLHSLNLEMMYYVMSFPE